MKKMKETRAPRMVRVTAICSEGAHMRSCYILQEFDGTHHIEPVKFLHILVDVLAHLSVLQELLGKPRKDSARNSREVGKAGSSPRTHCGLAKRESALRTTTPTRKPLQQAKFKLSVLRFSAHHVKRRERILPLVYAR